MSERTKHNKQDFKYPGVREAMDGNTAVIACERESSDAAGAYPITPSTQMGEFWAEAVAAGHINVSQRQLLFLEPEGEHAAAAVTAGFSMAGLRSTNFSSGQGIAYMHESLYAAVGKRLTYVLNVGARAMTKSTLNVHAAHDDYHAVDDTGFFQLFGASAQEVCDLNVIAHRIAELALNPGLVAQDGFLTTHLIESLVLPERELIEEYLGRPTDIIETPTPAQRIIFGDTRPRIPELWDVDNPVLSGPVQNQDSYMQSVASQRPFFFDHILELTEQAMQEYYTLTGRRYKRVTTYRTEDADYLIVGQGSMIPNAQAVADYLREHRDIKVGVVNVIMFRPFPGDLLGPLLKGRKGVAVLERTDQPLAEDLPLMREVRTALNKCLENGRSGNGSAPYPNHATYRELADLAPLYSGVYGLGSRDLQPEALIGAVENMLDDGKKRKFFYMSIDFVREKPYTTKQQIHQDKILEHYPNVGELAVRGSENPNLMPEGSITARFHSVGGWGAITTGKNLAMTLFDLLGYHIKANPKYGSEKKGQPTTYYLSAAPEPIRLNSEYYYVDVVLSPDPNVFSHSNALAGLKKGGAFIIQSYRDSAEAVWNDIPPRYQKMIVENDIKLFYVDGFKIARDEASDPELQFRMQGIAFQGAFFKASPVMEQAGFTEQELFKAIEAQLESKFGAKGRQVVEDNLRVVRRGYDESQEVVNKPLATAGEQAIRKSEPLPPMLKRLPASKASSTDIHRFWEQNGYLYNTGAGGDNLTDPYMAQSLMPMVTGVFRDMTAIRFEHPEWIPERCTGCGECWTVCPDSAIPGLVHKPQDVLHTIVSTLEEKGRSAKHLRRSVSIIERKLRAHVDAGGESSTVTSQLLEALHETKAESRLEGQDKQDFEQECSQFEEEIKDFKFAVTKPFYSSREKQQQGSGGLLSITVDPYACKGCNECIRVCPEGAFKAVTQTDESVETLRKNWDFWLRLPNTSSEFMQIDDLEEGIGVLENLLLDKQAYKSVVGGDGACMGCGEKTVIHLFTATVEALMQPRVRQHVQQLEELIENLERHIRLKIAESMDVGNVDALQNALSSVKDRDLTVSNLTSALEDGRVSQVIDSEWLSRVTGILTKLKKLHWRYTEGVTGTGRANMGMINATGCTSVWGSTFPFNPYPFPWSNHLFQDCTSVALGIFEGHMAKMAEGFKAIRMAELELEDEYEPKTHDDFFRRFDWRQFTDEEFHLCPPVVAVGGDGALYDIGFQNLSRMLMTGKPVKVVALDTQVYSNTGGQACTSGFTGQVSDMAQYGQAQHGKMEIRKEIGLVGMGHRTSYILQGSMSHSSHLIESFIQGLQSKRPAIFNVYTPCQPEHGIGDDMSQDQAKLAVESRAYPLMTYDPDRGETFEDCIDLDGNPAIEDKWPTYTIDYLDDDGHPAKIEVPLTFADFAATEARFRKHFRRAPEDTWHEDMVPYADYLELSADEREGKYPYIWATDRKQRLNRLIVSDEIVEAGEDRQNFWAILRNLAGVDREVDTEAMADNIRTEVVQNLARGLMQLAGNGGASGAAELLSSAGASSPSSGNGGAAAAPSQEQASSSTDSQGGNGGQQDYIAPFIDQSECTSCGDCVDINPKIFALDSNNLAYIKNPQGGPFKDIVKAAEKCPTRCIYPGKPANPNEKDLDKWVKRAAKFNK